MKIYLIFVLCFASISPKTFLVSVEDKAANDETKNVANEKDYVNMKVTGNNSYSKHSRFL